MIELEFVGAVRTVTRSKHLQGTKLRTLEMRPEINIFGVPYILKAEVKVLNGFSGHADQNGLMQFSEDIRAKGQLSRVILVHGEPQSQEVLSNRLLGLKFNRVDIPSPGQRLIL